MKLFGLALALLLALPLQAQQRDLPGKDGTPPVSAPAGDAGKPRARLPIGLSITISPALLFPRRPAASEDEAFEAGQLLVLWPDAASTERGPATLAALGLVPVQTVQLGELGATLALLQLPDMAQARLWRDRLRSEQPDWVVDLNARVVPMQDGVCSEARR